jgi:hypothetical protein
MKANFGFYLCIEAARPADSPGAGGRKKFKFVTRNATTQVYTLSTAQDEILAQRLLVSAQKILVAALGNNSYPVLRIWIEMTL